MNKLEKEINSYSRVAGSSPEVFGLVKSVIIEKLLGKKSLQGKDYYNYILSKHLSPVNSP